MKQLLATAALVITAAAPANASVYTVLRNNSLTRDLESVGTKVSFSGKHCDEPIYGYYKPATNHLVVCVANHVENGEMDYSELGDTLRHEAMHVAQTCNGKGTAVPILSWTTISKYSNNRILSIVQRYAPEDQHIEYEAFTAAAVMSNQQVGKIVKDYCL